MSKSPKNYLSTIQSNLLQSEQLKNCPNSQALLKYLITCYLEDRKIKEKTIAAEVFNRDKDFHPGEDPLVRVHIHNLRKRLEEYYKDAGKNDKYIIEIQKGKYGIHLISSKSRMKPTEYISKTTKYFCNPKILFMIVGVICVILLLNNIRLLNQLEKYRIVDKNDPIWGAFMEKQNENVMVCGDHFFYTIPFDLKKRSIHIRDTWINSYEELKQLIFPSGEHNIQPSMQTYFPHSCIWGLPGIIKILHCSSNPKIVMRASSQLTATLIEEQNMIYVGNIKSLGLLSHYVEQANFHYDIRDRVLYHYSGTDTTIFETEAHEDIFHKDYALILKWQGSRDNTILIITSFFTIGVKEAIMYITDKNLLKITQKSLRESCGFVPNNFKIVLKVTGIEQAITESNFVVMESLDSHMLRIPFGDTLKIDTKTKSSE